jgi:hypothetical protein
MSEAKAKIVRLERSVLWRKRLQSLQDGLVLAVMTGGLMAAALVLLVRLRPIGLPSWTVIVGAMSLAFAAALIRSFLTRASGSDAAFLIDESLKLDDRVATSHLIIERGGPRRGLEEALIEDAADRAGNQRAASVVPFKMRRWYTLSLVSLVGLVAALMIPTRSLPAAGALAAERADIESAGEHLEQTATEVEQAVPRGTETATLAKEQAELGRGFRSSPSTRAEALRRLNSLEGRIRGRHDDLASTRADEIVSLADRRLGGALSTLATSNRKRLEADESRLASPADELAGASKREPNKETRAAPPSGVQKPSESSPEKALKSRPTGSRTQAPTKGDHPDMAGPKTKRQAGAEPQNRPQEPVPGKALKAASTATDSTRPDPGIAKGTASEPGASGDQKPAEQKPSDLKAEGEKSDDLNTGERKADDKQPSEQPTGSLDALKAVPSSLAEQAAKTLPRVSAELLKKAAELRANELSPADIEKLRKAAESLSRDLAPIAQSKELQQALQEMARQIRPEQIEQVARELADQEKLKQELDAAARLLMENQQAKEMVAGLAGQFARVRDEKRQQDNGQPNGKSGLRDEETRARNQASRSNRANTGGAPEKFETADRRLAGQGRESSLKGKLQQGFGGEYLYLQTKAGVGVARTPYSSAYPQYRREAERSVQRSQVPPNLRSVVRKYFDAINPDAKK